MSMVTLFAALADDSRIKMVDLLASKERTVEELQNSLQISQSSTSQHLKILRDAELVSFSKHGNFRIYALNKARIRYAMQFFSNLWEEDLNQLKQNLEK